MDKVNPENGIAWTQQPSKSAAIKKTWNSFVESSTLHGMHYVFTSPTTFRRILWAFFLLSGMGYFSFHSSKLLEKYFSYPIATKVTLVHEKEPDFPSVTICNFNMFRKSLVNAYNYEQVLRYTTRDQFGKFAGIEINDSNIDWSIYEGVNMSLVYHLGGHQMQDMLKGCSWSGEKCSYKNFTPVLTSMGLCHTFNSGKCSKKMCHFLSSGNCFSLLECCLTLVYFQCPVTNYRRLFLSMKYSFILVCFIFRIFTRSKFTHSLKKLIINNIISSTKAKHRQW